MNTLCRTILAISVAVFWTNLSLAQVKLTLISWNVESGQADPEFLASAFKERQGVDLWGLSEVQNDEAAEIFEGAAEEGEDADGDGNQDDFVRIVGTTGNADRLVILLNTTRFELLDQFELSDINQGGHRAPLVAHLRGRKTGLEFLFMVNHLARGNAELRRDQARKLNTWAREQSIPIIAVGDYNFDWEVVGGDHPQGHDPGYDFMTRDAVFTWVRPATLVSTQLNPEYNSVLDFVFTAGSAFGWSGESEIIVENRFSGPPSDQRKSDHRPVTATFTLQTGDERAPILVAGRPTPNRHAERRGRPDNARLEDRVIELERKIKDLERLLRARQ